ncbi:MAG: hypothetical protein IT244_09235, partial [Bacteroidia bacterium]|nr:hypothetical protein [Bacteroidia bacterium]
VTHDYSMGFAGNIGFRAATAHSFKFYDLSNEKSTELVVHPFCVMDVGLKNYLHLDVASAIKTIENLKDICKAEKAPFCFIFHNESVSDNEGWTGWRNVFETCLK